MKRRVGSILVPFKRRSKKIGVPPGTLVHVGERRVDSVRVTVMEYNAEGYREWELEAGGRSLALSEKSSVTWINIDGLHEVDVIAAVGERLGLHALVVEDILNTDQRPKQEEFGDYLFIVFKMLLPAHSDRGLLAEQVSLVLGPKFVLSVQEARGDVFDPIRERIRAGKGRVREMGGDYLAYALLDAVVDNYFSCLEKLGERVEALEGELLVDPGARSVREIHELRRELILVRKAVWPLREVLSRLVAGETTLIGDAVKPFLRDVYDHAVQVIDVVETFREMVSAMLDIYLSSVSHRTNEAMKVLTVIATLFMPLTFIAGVYGMNFRYMPELEWRWGYPAVWAAMLGVVILMIGYFRRRGWW